jgi:hypothetical protein
VREGALHFPTEKELGSVSQVPTGGFSIFMTPSPHYSRNSLEPISLWSQIKATSFDVGFSLLPFEGLDVVLVNDKQSGIDPRCGILVNPTPGSFGVMATLKT